MQSLKSLYLFLTILVLLFNVNQLQAEAPNPNALQAVPRPRQYRTCMNIFGVICKIPLGRQEPCYPTCTPGPLVPVSSNLMDCPFQRGINANGPAALFCRGPQLHRTCMNFHGNKKCKIPLGRQEPCYPGTPGFNDKCIEGLPVPAPSNLRVCPFQPNINPNGPAAIWCRPRR